jgi:hypothetical protein
MLVSLREIEFNRPAAGFESDVGQVLPALVCIDENAAGVQAIAA